MNFARQNYAYHENLGKLTLKSTVISYFKAYIHINFIRHEDRIITTKKENIRAQHSMLYTKELYLSVGYNCDSSSVRARFEQSTKNEYVHSLSIVRTVL